MKVSCGNGYLNIGVAIMKTYHYEGMKLHKIRNGYKIVIKEYCGKRHKIFYKTFEDVTEYINGLAFVMYKQTSYTVPSGYASKKDLKNNKMFKLEE